MNIEQTRTTISMIMCSPDLKICGYLKPNQLKILEDGIPFKDIAR